MTKQVSNLKAKVIWGAVILLGVVHQDFWFWNTYEPLVFGFVPIGLAYHAAISIAAAILWLLATKHCWPAYLEDDE